MNLLSALTIYQADMITMVLTLKTLIYEGTDRMKPLVTEFVTEVTKSVTLVQPLR
jgi:hypothetical protein